MLPGLPSQADLCSEIILVLDNKHTTVAAAAMTVLHMVPGHMPCGSTWEVSSNPEKASDCLEPPLASSRFPMLLLSSPREAGAETEFGNCKMST